MKCRLSPEEIRAQKILLEYYKMQQEKKEKRKSEKSRKGKKRSIVCLRNVFVIPKCIENCSEVRKPSLSFPFSLFCPFSPVYIVWAVTLCDSLA